MLLENCMKGELILYLAACVCLSIYEYVICENLPEESLDIFLANYFDFADCKHN